MVCFATYISGDDIPSSGEVVDISSSPDPLSDQADTFPDCENHSLLSSGTLTVATVPTHQEKNVCIYISYTLVFIVCML